MKFVYVDFERLFGFAVVQLLVNRLKLGAGHLPILNRLAERGCDIRGFNCLLIVFRNNDKFTVTAGRGF